MDYSIVNLPDVDTDGDPGEGHCKPAYGVFFAMQGKIKPFVTIEFDEFDGKTQTKHKKELKFGGNLITIKNKLRRVQIDKERFDSLIFDYSAWTKGMWFFQHIIIIADGKKIKSDYREIRHEVMPYNNTFDYLEVGHLHIKPADVLAIGKASEVKVRFYSKEDHLEPESDWINDFQNHCRQFYNNVYDDLEFAETVKSAPSITSKEEVLENVQMRAAKLNALQVKRNIWLALFLIPVIVLTLALFGGKIEIYPPVFWLFELPALAILGTMWIVPQLEIIAIQNQINKECPNCHLQTIKNTGSSRSFYGVRSKEEIVANRLTGANESKQVTVSDYEVTTSYECTNCFHMWSRSYIEEG